jgi:predicted DNA-binding transcriptional regulator AlpA
MPPSVGAASVADPPRDAASAVSSPFLLRATEAAGLCRVSLRTWRAWDATGKVPQPVRIGRAVFWRLEELRAWVAAGCPDRAAWQPGRK